jgi:hypothetical protein
MNERSFIVKSLSAISGEQEARRLKAGCEPVVLQDPLFKADPA